MKIYRLSLLLMLVFLIFAFGFYGVYKGMIMDNSEAVNLSINNISSTKEWQDTLQMYLNKRNELFNDVLDGKYEDSKKRASMLKTLECPPLLHGDIALLDYMSKNPMQFANRKSNIKVEYCEIRHLTDSEIKIVAKISYMENDTLYQYDYEVGFNNIDGRWLLSKFAYVI